MRRVYLFTIFIAVLGFHLTACNKNVKTETEPEVKNVILMIGDGMGVTQVYAALTANKGELHLEQSQFVGFSKTYSADKYITDSAAGGTAIACGVKTNNGSIGLDADGNPAKSLLEYAQENQMLTGVVVSCDVTHATPAAFVAHQANRNMAEEIAVDFAESDLTLFIGGGKKRFDNRTDSVNLLDQLKAKDFQIAFSMEDAKKVSSGKLAALLAEEHPAQYPERGELLPEGVQLAIDLMKDHDKGFCLMVEGSQIDWACHANETEALLSEMLDFDRAIKVAFDYADQDPNTLVIVTADHETGGLSLTGGDFATGDVKADYASKGHTSVMVPVFAYGAQARKFAGIYENTDIFSKILELYGIER